MKKTLILTAGLVVFAMVLVYAFSGTGNNKNKEIDNLEKDRFRVKTETVSKRDLKNELLVSGSMKALEEAVLYPRSEGKLLRNVLKEGDKVSRNQTVSLVERDEVGAVYEPVVVPSTINGVVGRVYLDSGANVTRTTPIAFVVNQSKVRILLDIPERYSGRIYKGQPATFTVESLPGETFEAKVNVISPVVDNLSRSVAIELLADNGKERLKSGMFAKANIALSEKKNALSVHSVNIFADDNGVDYVLVPNDGVAQRRDVTLGFTDANYTEITKGLKEGDEVINFVFGIKDGSKIAVAQDAAK
ncbi:multidrug efflux pump subunit AcrA (membrane-fusion protein) [Elusimicrobium posterum]|uniref:efflux RND transporter periplasmic adaptor subunit n=1 Tax=Elusimicrobium posterum TaxID=3116653 RepID=UPI003C792305